MSFGIPANDSKTVAAARRASFQGDNKWKEEIKRDLETKLDKQVRDALQTPTREKPRRVRVTTPVNPGKSGESSLKPWQLLQHRQRLTGVDGRSMRRRDSGHPARNPETEDRSRQIAHLREVISARGQYLRNLREERQDDLYSLPSADFSPRDFSSADVQSRDVTSVKSVRFEGRGLVRSEGLDLTDRMFLTPPLSTLERPYPHTHTSPQSLNVQPSITKYNIYDDYDDDDDDDDFDTLRPLYGTPGYHLSTKYFSSLYDGPPVSGSWARRPTGPSDGGVYPPGLLGSSDMSQLSASEQLSYFYTFTKAGFQYALRNGRLADGSELVQVGVGSYRDRYGLIRDLHGPFWPVDYGPLYPAPVHIRTNKSSSSAQPQNTQNFTTGKSSQVQSRLFPARWKGLSVVYDSERSPRDHKPPLLGEGHCPSLVFESRFESGNLRQARRIGEFEYELVLQTDLYTSRHTQWFYFRVCGAVKHCTYTFKIINLHKRDSLYSYGMQPLLYSDKQAAEKKEGWTRVGYDISYNRNLCNLQCPLLNRDRAYYVLEWKMEFPHSDDTCYLAHCYPYTFTDLRNDLDLLMSDKERSRVMKREVMCTTRSGNSCFLVTVTDFESTESLDKKGVVITSRVHPGETNSSWIMKGLLEYLTGPSRSAKELRRRLVFKIVPMLNPDGVIVGNYRCSLAGRDLNRNYRNPSKETFPTVWHTKNMVENFRHTNTILFYCDIHGHSVRQNVFMYGCSSYSDWTTAAVDQQLLPNQLWSASTADLTTYLRDRLIPWLMRQQAPDKFSFEGCHYRIEKCKESTGRVVMYRQCNIRNSFTMEASFSGCNMRNSKGEEGHQFYTSDLEEMGRALCDMAMIFKKTIDDKLYESRVLMQLAKYLMLQQLRLQKIEQRCEEEKISYDTAYTEENKGCNTRNCNSSDLNDTGEEFRSAEDRQSEPVRGAEPDYSEMIDQAGTFDKCLRIMEEMRLTDTLNKISGSSSDSDSESDPEGTRAISADKRVRNKNKKSKSTGQDTTSAADDNKENKKKKNKMSKTNTELPSIKFGKSFQDSESIPRIRLQDQQHQIQFGEAYDEGLNEKDEAVHSMMRRRKQLMKSYPAFVNHYEGRTNHGIPCYTEERLNQRAHRRQQGLQNLSEECENRGTVDDLCVEYMNENRNRNSGMSERRFSLSNSYTGVNPLYGLIQNQQQQAKLKPIIFMPSFPRDKTNAMHIRTRSSTANRSSNYSKEDPEALLKHDQKQRYIQQQQQQQLRQELERFELQSRSETVMSENRANYKHKNRNSPEKIQRKSQITRERLEDETENVLPLGVNVNITRDQMMTDHNDITAENSRHNPENLLYQNDVRSLDSSKSLQHNPISTHYRKLSTHTTSQQEYQKCADDVLLIDEMFATNVKAKELQKIPETYEQSELIVEGLKPFITSDVNRRSSVVKLDEAKQTRHNKKSKVKAKRKSDKKVLPCEGIASVTISPDEDSLKENLHSTENEVRPISTGVTEDFSTSTTMINSLFDNKLKQRRDSPLSITSGERLLNDLSVKDNIKYRSNSLSHEIDKRNTSYRNDTNRESSDSVIENNDKYESKNDSIYSDMPFSSIYPAENDENKIEAQEQNKAESSETKNLQTNTRNDDSSSSAENTEENERRNSEQLEKRRDSKSIKRVKKKKKKKQKNK